MRESWLNLKKKQKLSRVFLHPPATIPKTPSISTLILSLSLPRKLPSDAVFERRYRGWDWPAWIVVRRLFKREAGFDV